MHNMKLARVLLVPTSLAINTIHVFENSRDTFYHFEACILTLPSSRPRGELLNGTSAAIYFNTVRCPSADMLGLV